MYVGHCVKCPLEITKNGIEYSTHRKRVIIKLLKRRLGGPQSQSQHFRRRDKSLAPVEV